jgi:hypothetical protein
VCWISGLGPFMYLSANTQTDDGALVIKPTDNAGAGRWVFRVPQMRVGSASWLQGSAFGDLLQTITSVSPVDVTGSNLTIPGLLTGDLVFIDHQEYLGSVPAGVQALTRVAAQEGSGSVTGLDETTGTFIGVTGVTAGKAGGATIYAMGSNNDLHLKLQAWSGSGTITVNKPVSFRAWVIRP